MQALLSLLDDLHKLEVNTIVKNGLTAQKMPAPLLALHRIATEYEAYCQMVGLPLEDVSDRSIRRRFDAITQAATAGQDPFFRQNDSEAHAKGLILARIADSAHSLLGMLERAKRAWDEDQGNADLKKAFAKLARELAKKKEGRVYDPAYERFRGEFDAAFYRSFYARFRPRSLKPELTVFETYWADRRQADTTGPILDILYDMPAAMLQCLDRGEVNRAWQLSAADRGLIRKIWELGVEEVMVQTVIQIEGDVTNRISPLAGDPERAHVLDLHQRGIDTSLRMWGDMVRVAKDLVQAVFNALGGR